MDAHRELVRKAALDNMAGATVSALFATMAARAAGVEVDEANKDNGPGEGKTPGAGGGVSAEARGGSELRHSGNQGGEEENGPRRDTLDVGINTA